MANYIIVTKDCTVRASGEDSATFEQGDQVAPGNPNYLILLWSGLATDSGDPAPTPDPPVALKDLRFAGTPVDGDVAQYNGTTGRWQLTQGGGGGGGNILVLGADDPVPGDTPEDTVIVRKAE